MKQEFTTLENSALFFRQDEAYEAFGLDSWTKKGVPFSLTNSISMAQRYALFIQRYLVTISGKVPILELGAGSGKLCFLILTILKQRLANDLYSRIRFILTDKASSVFRCWQKHISLQEFVDDGVLEFKIFDALNHSFSEFTFENPPFIIANYFFDTIEQSLFAKREGTLYEGQIQLKFNGSSPDDLASVKETYSFFSTHKKLDLYEELDNGIILWPVGGFRVLEAMDQALEDFCLLIGDKGDHTLEHIEQRLDPKLNRHATFSFPVNFHALMDFARKKGCSTLECEPEVNFSVVSIQKGEQFSALFTNKDLNIKVDPQLDPHVLHIHRNDFLHKVGPWQYKKLVKDSLTLVFRMQESDLFVHESLLESLEVPIISVENKPLGSTAVIGQDLMLSYKKGPVGRVFNNVEQLVNKTFDTLFFITLGEIFIQETRFEKIDQQILSYNDDELKECMQSIAEIELVSPELIVSFFLDLFQRGKIKEHQLHRCYDYFIRKGLIQECDKRSNYKIKKSQLGLIMIKNIKDEHVQKNGELILILLASNNALKLAQELCLDYTLSVEQSTYFVDENKILQIKIKTLY